MLILSFATAILLAPAAAAPSGASKPIPVRDEPHHHVVLENAHLRAFRVSIPAGEATILHQHDLPYFFVMMGPAAFANDVTGKPDVHVVMTDGQAAYSRGGFSHVIRPDAGTAFNNVTVELLDPPGELHNLCQKVVADAPLDCHPAAPQGGPSPLWETGAIRVTSLIVAPKDPSYSAPARLARLLVVGQNSEVTVAVARKPKIVVHGGDLLWLEEGTKFTTITTDGPTPARLLEVVFKGTEPSQKP